MRTIILGLILILTQYSCKQISQSQNDTNIVTIGSTTIEYSLEEEPSSFYKAQPLEINGILSENKVKTIKVDYFEECETILSSNLFLTEKLIQLSLDKKLKVKSNKDEQELSENQILELLRVSDTIIFESNILQESIGIVTKPVNLSAITAFSIKQYWCFDKKAEKLFTIPYEVIPIIYNEGKRKELFRILFPFDTPDESEININDLNNVWIKESFNEVDILNNFENVKGDFKAFIKEKYWNEPVSNQRKAFEPFKPYCDVPIFDLSQIEVIETVDTIITFSPETYEEEIQFVRNKAIKHEDIVAFKLRQIWVFNEVQLSLKSYLKSVTPLIIREYGEGERRLHPGFRVDN